MYSCYLTVYTEFINNKLIDEIIISIIPLVLGDGIKLFQNAVQTRLSLKNISKYDSGLVQITYKLI
ncbi:MAG TPA: hypothetical protein ENN33_10485 [Ignavibacteria bacterium]|nr:hypothetical protein [Ignavibacteria bacterium]